MMVEQQEQEQEQERPVFPSISYVQTVQVGQEEEVNVSLDVDVDADGDGDGGGEERVRPVEIEEVDENTPAVSKEDDDENARMLSGRGPRRGAETQAQTVSPQEPVLIPEQISLPQQLSITTPEPVVLQEQVSASESNISERLPEPKGTFIDFVSEAVPPSEGSATKKVTETVTGVEELGGERETGFLETTTLSPELDPTYCHPFPPYLSSRPSSLLSSSSTSTSTLRTPALTTPPLDAVFPESENLTDTNGETSGGSRRRRDVRSKSQRGRGRVGRSSISSSNSSSSSRSRSPSLSPSPSMTRLPSISNAVELPALSRSSATLLPAFEFQQPSPARSGTSTPSDSTLQKEVVDDSPSSRHFEKFKYLVCTSPLLSPAVPFDYNSGTSSMTSRSNDQSENQVTPQSRTLTLKPTQPSISAHPTPITSPKSNFSPSLRFLSAHSDLDQRLSLPLPLPWNRLDIYLAFLVALGGIWRIAGRLWLQALAGVVILVCGFVGVVVGDSKVKERNQRSKAAGEESKVEMSPDNQEQGKTPQVISELQTFIYETELFDNDISRLMESPSFAHAHTKSFESALQSALKAIESALSKIVIDISLTEYDVLKQLYEVDDSPFAPGPPFASETPRESPNPYRFPKERKNRYISLPSLSSPSPRPRPSTLAALERQKSPGSPLRRIVDDETDHDDFPDQPSRPRTQSDSQRRTPRGLRQLRLSFNIPSPNSNSAANHQQPPHSPISKRSQQPITRPRSILLGRSATPSRSTHLRQQSRDSSDMQDFINGLPVDLVHSLKAQTTNSPSRSRSRPTSYLSVDTPSRTHPPSDDSFPGGDKTSLEPTANSLEDMVLLLQIRRRKLACYFLALPEPTKAVPTLHDLSSAFRLARESLPALPVHEYIPHSAPATTASAEGFAPRFSDRTLFNDHLSVLSSLLRHAQSQVELLENVMPEGSSLPVADVDVGMLQHRWDSVREDLGGMIKEWERGRQVLQRVRVETPWVKPTTAGDPEENIPAFVKNWESENDADADGAGLPSNETSLVTDAEAIAQTPEDHATIASHDDATSHLLESSSVKFLPPPGIEAVFEGISGRARAVEVKSKMSRDERIAMIRQEREAAAAVEKDRDCSKSNSNGVEMVSELRDVIGELRRRREEVCSAVSCKEGNNRDVEQAT